MSRPLIQRGAQAAEQGTSTTSLEDRLGVPASLFALYIIWGSTYLAIRFAVADIPPFLMGGVRFTFAGAVLYAVLRLRGTRAPTQSEWRGGAVVGLLLILVGNGGVAFAEQWVASGLAAMMVATTPLWAALFAGLWGRWPNRLETVGLAVGFVGVVLLNLQGDLRANPLGAAVLLVSPCGWALGSIWSRHLALPLGLMATAVEMLIGGALQTVLGLAVGERLPLHPSARSVLAFIYLVVVGAWIAFSAYGYLLRRVRPALATSYAYVNPVVAVLLGIWLGGERLGLQGAVALAVILGGVVVVILARTRTDVAAD